MNTLYGIGVVIAFVLWACIAVMFIAWVIKGLRKPRLYNASVCVVTRQAAIYTVYECEGVDEAEAILDLNGRVQQEYKHDLVNLRVYDVYVPSN